MVKKNAPRMGHLPIQWVLQLHVGHLNSFLELRDGNLTAKNQKVQMPGGDVEVTIRSVHKSHALHAGSTYKRVSQ